MLSADESEPTQPPLFPSRFRNSLRRPLGTCWRCLAAPLSQANKWFSSVPREIRELHAHLLATRWLNSPSRSGKSHSEVENFLSMSALGSETWKVEGAQGEMRKLFINISLLLFVNYLFDSKSKNCGDGTASVARRIFLGIRDLIEPEARHHRTEFGFELSSARWSLSSEQCHCLPSLNHPQTRPPWKYGFGRVEFVHRISQDSFQTSLTFRYFTAFVAPTPTVEEKL